MEFQQKILMRSTDLHLKSYFLDSYHNVMPLHFRFFLRQFLALQFEAICNIKKVVRKLNILEKLLHIK